MLRLALSTDAAGFPYNATLIASILRGIEGVEFIEFDQADVVRHPVVRRIIQAYESHRKKDEPPGGPAKG